jgi:hypothetical protein
LSVGCGGSALDGGDENVLPFLHEAEEDSPVANAATERVLLPPMDICVINAMRNFEKA